MMCCATTHHTSEWARRSADGSAPDLYPASDFLARHGNGRKCRAGLYARVSTNDQQTLAMQNRAMREHHH
jgi:hypothetical protein